MKFDFEEFTSHEKFSEIYGNIPYSHPIVKARHNIEKMTQECKMELFRELSGKYPLITQSKPLLLTAICRLIQARHYQNIYKKEPSAVVIAKDNDILSKIGFRDTMEEAVTQQPARSKDVDNKEESVKPVVTEETTTKAPKEKKPKSELSQKISGMDLAAVIKWAQELGVPQEKIDKHKDKPLGLAKMNLGNLIRPKIKA